MDLVASIRDERTADKADSVEADVLRGVLDCKPRLEQGMVRVGDIVDAVNATRPDHFKITPPRVGKRLSAMGFAKGKVGKSRAVIWDDDLVQRLERSYGLSEEPSNPSHLS